MAEGFANHYGKSWLIAHSAGTSAVGFIMPNTIQAMQEKGIDVSRQSSKGFRDVDLKAMDWIVVMEPALAELVPKSSPNAEKIIWLIPDPVGQSLDVYRKVRDQIELEVVQFLDIVRKST
jgi:arsenate reductase